MIVVQTERQWDEVFWQTQWSHVIMWHITAWNIYGGIMPLAVFGMKYQHTMQYILNITNFFPLSITLHAMINISAVCCIVKPCCVCHMTSYLNNVLSYLAFYFNLGWCEQITSQEKKRAVITSDSFSILEIGGEIKCIMVFSSECTMLCCILHVHIMTMHCMCMVVFYSEHGSFKIPLLIQLETLLSLPTLIKTIKNTFWKGHWLLDDLNFENCNWFPGFPPMAVDDLWSCSNCMV